MLELPLLTILAPFIAGLIVLAIPDRFKGFHEAVSAAVSVGAFILGYLCFRARPLEWSFNENLLLKVDTLSASLGLFIGLFGVLVTFYSMSFMKGRKSSNEYYAYLIWTLAASMGAAFSNNLVLFLGFWGFLGFTLYALISLGGEDSAYAAKKTFIIVGGSDAAMLFGVAIIWYLAGTFDMAAIKLDLNTSRLATVAFLCLAIGAFAKAGAMPFHTWIPDSSEAAPTPVMAYLPASLDKLLGIYLLARLTLNMFVLKANSAMSIFLLTIGSITIIAAVMMALVQHNLKRLLAYHAVSQVGYMVLGIGTANPIGIAGGLFHMINHAIYKSCLFLSAGSVEKTTGTTELDRLGDLARFMPITFITCLIASLAISGVSGPGGGRKKRRQDLGHLVSGGDVRKRSYAGKLHEIDIFDISGSSQRHTEEIDTGSLILYVGSSGGACRTVYHIRYIRLPHPSATVHLTKH
jgi:formate hydrogenlyase subunit 3/multisubunit Na+/H+ antiporter MnhD subunit